MKMICKTCKCNKHLDQFRIPKGRNVPNTECIDCENERCKKRRERLKKEKEMFY